MYAFEFLKQHFIVEAITNPVVRMYAGGRLDAEGRYTGWVKSCDQLDQASLDLDLKAENDQFLLFCLASAWSATGPWENAATLIYTIKNYCPDQASPNAWIDDASFETSITVVKHAFAQHKDVFNPRKSTTIRKDIFPAFRTLARKWPQLKFLMQSAARSSNWEQFVYDLRDVEGLAPGRCGTKKLLIKIPLILRELRCQNIFSNIPGELCCVPDARVIDAIKVYQLDPEYDQAFGLKAYRPSDARALIESSKAIYQIFGDLYDLPLFAAEDIYSSIKEAKAILA